MDTAFETTYDERFHLSRRALYGMLAASTLWFTVDGTPVLPIGLLFCIRHVGINYEATFLRSLLTGRKVVLACLGMALLGLLLVGPRLGFALQSGRMTLHAAFHLALG